MYDITRQKNPTSCKQHIPWFIDTLAKESIIIVALTANDVFVMGAWSHMGGLLDMTNKNGYSFVIRRIQNIIYVSDLNAR